MNESSPYDVEFDWDGAHGRLVALLSKHVEPGVVVDLGCGYAPHATALDDAGFTYVGFDVDVASVEAVRALGHDAATLDLGDVDAVIAALDAVRNAHDSPIAAVLAIDVIEHLAIPQVLLAELSAWMRSHDVPTFGVSVPNVAHRDLAAKLLAGRWDVTESGLLDHTHLRFFTDRSLTTVLASCGFDETARADRSVVESDQRWVLGSETTRLGSATRRFRDRMDDHGDTYQFIRLYTPSASVSGGAPSLVQDLGQPRCFLSVVADPSCDDAALARLEAQLAAQTNTDWELVPRAELAGESGDAALRRSFGRANGAYVAIVGPDDHLDPTWVAEFAAIRIDGAILRAAANVAQSNRNDDSNDENDDTASGIGELVDLDAPSATFAFPAEALTGSLTRSLDVPVATSLFLDLFQYCGVIATAAATVDSAPSGPIDRRAIARRIAEIDAAPMLVPAGEIARRNADRTALADAQRRVGELTSHVALLESDNAWMASELSVPPVTALRKLLRRRPSRG